MAALRPGCALSVFTWGATGQITASHADLDELAAAITSPDDALAPRRLGRSLSRLGC